MSRLEKCLCKALISQARNVCHRKYNMEIKGAKTFRYSLLRLCTDRAISEATVAFKTSVEGNDSLTYKYILRHVVNTMDFREHWT